MEKTLRRANKLDGLLLAATAVAAGGFIWLANQISWTAQMYRAVHAGFGYMLPSMLVALAALLAVIFPLAYLARYGRDFLQAMLESIERRRVTVVLMLAAGYWFLFQCFF